jgi:hypothetical protein
VSSGVKTILFLRKIVLPDPFQWLKVLFYNGYLSRNLSSYFAPFIREKNIE